MPMGAPGGPGQNYASRVWGEGRVITGNPLRVVAPVPFVIFGGVWEQFPSGLNDSIVFENIALEVGEYNLYWLVAESVPAATDVDIAVNGFPFLSGVNLNAPVGAMAEIRGVMPVNQTFNTVSFVNRSGGFIAGIYFSLQKII